MLLLISESNEMETANINMFDKYSKQDVGWGLSLEYVGVSVCQSEVYLYLQSMLDVGVSEF